MKNNTQNKLVRIVNLIAKNGLKPRVKVQRHKVRGTDALIAKLPQDHYLFIFGHSNGIIRISHLRNKAKSGGDTHIGNLSTRDTNEAFKYVKAAARFAKSC